ncbi:hypothetical protein [Renibacterium salmoninarum]|nr:hypothetical protein [Renibacterium salmoninarum]
MSEGMLGADPAALRELGRDFDNSANLISEARALLAAKINGPLQWHGADAFFFQHVLNSSHAPTLRNAAQMLSDCSRTLAQQAQEQEDASAANGG